MPTAIIVRIIMGSALIYFAPYSKFPIAFRIFGTLGLVAAVGLVVMGWQRIDNIMQWIDKWPMWITRAWLLFGLSLGALLLYGHGRLASLAANLGVR